MEFLKKYYPWFTGGAVFIIYLFTLAPTVMQIDAGELSAVQYTLGIAHPTGYPLFTIIGYLFLKLPLPFTKIFQSNILASIFCTLAVVFFIKSAALLLGRLSAGASPAGKEKKKPSKNAFTKIEDNISNVEKIFILISSGLIIAFNATFWQQSNSVEVYSLQALLFCLILLTAFNFLFKEKLKTSDYLILAAVAALGYSNHLTTLFTMPGLIYIFFVRTRFSKEMFKKLFFMFIIFSGVLTFFYSYLFLRASQNPELNWGNPFNLDNFLRHVTGKQYQVWMFSSFEDAKKQLIDYFKSLPSVFGYLSLVFSAVGFVFLFRSLRKVFIFLLITYLFSVLYTINYSIHDISSYFLLSHICLSIAGVFGIYKIFIFVKRKFSNVYYSYGTVTVIILLMFILNFGKADASGIYVFEDYTKAILNSVPNNSVIFSYQWDYFVAPSYYFQKVENLRKDVTVIDKELLRRSWYYNQMEKNFPEVIKGIKPEIEQFLNALKPFEHDEEFDSNQLEFYYRAIMTNLISTNIDSRDYFIGPELVESEMQRGEFKLPEGCSMVPCGLLFKVVKDTSYIKSPGNDIKIRFPKEIDSYASFIYSQTGKMLLRRAIYEIGKGKITEAREIVLKIRENLPEFEIPADILNKIKI